MTLRLSLFSLGFATVFTTQTLFAAEPVRPRFEQQTDALGFNWDVQPQGIVGDGHQDCFDSGFRLWVRNNEFQSRTQALSDKGEFLLSNKYGNVEITRNILLDRKAGVIRYLEILKNVGQNPEKVNLRLGSYLGDAAQQLVTDRGKPFSGQLGKGDLGFIAMQNSQGSRPSFFWMFTDGASDPPNVKIESNRGFQVSRDFDLAPGQTVVFLHLGAQRGFDGVVKKGTTAFSMFLKRKQLADFAIPPDLQKDIVNYQFKEPEPEGDVAAEAPFRVLLEERELERPSQKDLLMVGGSTTLFGTLASSKIGIESQFGKRELAAADILAIRGNGPGGGLQIYLKTGEIISGAMTSEVIDFNELSGGLKMHLKPEEITLYIARAEMEPPKSPGGASGFLEFRSGDRLAIKGDVTIRVTSPWGELSVKTSEIRDLRYVREPFPAYQVKLIDGTTFPAMLSADKLPIDSLTFKALQVPSQAIAGFAAVVEKKSQSTGTYAECTLVGENKLVGKISTPELHVVSEDSAAATKIPSDQIVGLERIEGESSGVKGAAAFKITLAAGNSFPGQFSERIIEFASSGGRKWRVPLQQITGFELIEPEQEEEAPKAN